MRSLYLLLTVFLLSACVTEQESTDDNFNRIGAGGAAGRPIYWSNSAFPLTLKYASSFDGDFTGADYDDDGNNPIEQAMLEWDGALATKTFFNLPLSTTSNIEHGNVQSYKDGQMGIYKHYSWFDNVSAGALAVTQYFGYIRSGGRTGEYVELTHADIILNYNDYSFSTDKDSFDDYDMQSVILHELGHLLGLRHQSDFTIPSVMHPFMSIFDSKRSIEEYDRSKILENYDDGFLRPMNAASSVDRSKNQNDQDENQQDPMIRGLIELRADGHCLHYQDEKLIFKHLAFPKKIPFL